MSALTQIRLVAAGSEINLNNLHDHGADGKVWYIGTTSQVLEPITKPRKTNTPRGPDFSDLMPHVLGTIPQYMKGIFDSGVENFSLGCIHPQEPPKWSLGYKTGRQVGDALSIGAGKGIIGIGTDIGTSGAVVSVGSLGTAAAISIPVSALGFTFAAYGSAVAVKSATSFAADTSHSDNGSLNKVNNSQITDRKVSTGAKHVKLDQGNQDKHIVGTNNYKQEVRNKRHKRILTKDPQWILDNYADPSKVMNGTNRQRIHCDCVIDEYYDKFEGVEGGVYVMTRNAIIHYKKMDLLMLFLHDQKVIKEKKWMN